MEIIRNIEELKIKIKEVKENHSGIGFVPTMGYLHDGHRSLVHRARKENDFVVVSIFVNPTQFGPNEDLDKYPRNEEGDLKLCREEGCDLVFIPRADEMYDSNYNTYVDVFGLTEGLCGASRPGHFRGVCTVVLKLFNLVKADKAYFGQKDAQQLAVIRKMCKDLNMDVEVIGCPIIREKDGLAMSSRNSYLSEQERRDAVVLNKALLAAETSIQNGIVDAAALRAEMSRMIAEVASSTIDYIEIVDNELLKPVEKITGEVLIALAVKIGKTRLIDNRVVVAE